MNKFNVKPLETTDMFLPPHVVNEENPVMPQSQTLDWAGVVLNIPQIHELGYRGKGIVVAVIDTACDVNHPDLQGAIKEIINVTSEPLKATNHHGTAVTSLIAARDNEEGILGAAPECEIISIKAMRENGGGHINEIIKGIDEAIKRNVDVINLSLGTTSNVSSLRNAVKRATDKGIYVVCSAGNAGKDDSVVYPARYEECYAVGATNQSGYVSAFSSRGVEVDIAAPGERVLAAWKNGGYARVSGSSFSAPLCAGLFALMKEVGVEITHKLLGDTAIDIETPGKDIKSGHGMIDAFKIIRNYEENKPDKDNDDASGEPSDREKLKKAVEFLNNAHDLLRELLNPAE